MQNIPNVFAFVVAPNFSSRWSTWASQDSLILIKLDLVCNSFVDCAVSYNGCCYVLLWTGLQNAAEVQLKQPKEESGVVEGVDVSFKCHADGNPEPTVLWHRNKIRSVRTLGFLCVIIQFQDKCTSCDESLLQ